jgi:hypothetical protein
MVDGLKGLGKFCPNEYEPGTSDWSEISVAGLPVPETMIVSGLEGALLVTKTLPEYPPVNAGANLSVSENN